jgi:hypothetical protein
VLLISVHNLVGSDRWTLINSVKMNEQDGMVKTVQSQNYLTNDGRSASLSWCQATIRDT